jgi:TolB protein
VTLRPAKLLAIPAIVLLSALLVAPADAAFPGQNGRIALSSRDAVGTDRFGVFTVNPDGSGALRLTDEGPHPGELAPAWSPDGRKIAFSRHSPEVHEIWTMNADGSNQVQLTNDPVGRYAMTPTWSPDGARIAFERGGDIWIMNADGSLPTNITADEHMTATQPAWSPDGRRIAFTGIGDQTDIWLIRPDGTGLVNVTNTPGAAQNEDWPDWSPDGSQLVFTSHQGQVEVRIANADGSNRSTVAVGGRPAWSPDGTKIAFDGAGGTYTIRPDGSQQTFVRDGALPDWQPIRPAPQRGDFPNAAAFCRAEREFYGEQEFARRYGTGGQGANAFGKCVSRNN